MKKTYEFGNLKIYVEKDYSAMSKRSAEILLKQIQQKQDSLITVATGATPEGMYAQFCETVKKESFSLEKVRFHKLDEWQGLSSEDIGSCDYFIRKNIIDPLSIKEEQYWGVNGKASDPDVECSHVAERLKKEGPIDLCILGLGANGHLGLNEPSDKLSPYTHSTSLSEQSMSHSMLNSGNVEVKSGLTTGMTEIFCSRHILFIISGKQKSEKFKEFFSKEISTALPASFLWLHPHVTCICDEDAFSMIEV